MTSPPAENSHAMAYDSLHGQVVLFGRQGMWLWDWFQLDPAIPENQSWSTIWVWDGFNWTKIFPVNSPRPRAQHALAYASANQQVVLFGGSGNLFQGHVAFSDTWTWDGSNWTEQFPTNSPPLRYAHAMVYDSAESRSVMFGGFDEQLNSYDDTWV